MPLSHPIGYLSAGTQRVFLGTQSLSTSTQRVFLGSHNLSTSTKRVFLSIHNLSSGTKRVFSGTMLVQVILALTMHRARTHEINQYDIPPYRFHPIIVL